MTKQRKSVESQLSDGQSRECSMTVGRSKSIEPVRMVRGTLTLCSMGPLAVQLGRLGIRNSSLTRSQRKAARALELLGLEILAKLAEGRGVEKAGRELTPIPSKES